MISTKPFQSKKRTWSRINTPDEDNDDSEPKTRLDILRSVCIKKYLDTYISVFVDSTGSAVICNGMTQGYDISQMVGDEIRMLYLEMQLYYWTDKVTVSAPNLFRILLVYDRRPSTTYTFPSDVLNFGSPSAFQNVDTMDRYLILYDHTNICGSADTTAGYLSPNQHLIKERIPLNLNTIVDFSTGVYTGFLSLVYVNTQTPSGGIPPHNLLGTTRLVYEDY